ncbi:hypothetical protein SAMN05660489_00155 [Pseudomonas sp. LAMO17WK12:I10]|uniref:type II toxin-antitoxin system VapC family toxin n=1 Tax=unclassified Pseudomonas TaxID=196821 RepID=UPI000BC68761|nr:MULTISPECIES: type II toxin-antitoxin system VapC family toxin [unclassified Pseudomonas]PXX76595.1 hypothetical protein H160_00366 [Pseudomonas sp. LAMO17WK12:I9]SNY04271.1 hypothetical protein SAMN05660489_00155 [Pseudomonas sp. LAMO17WK12:I10]
MIVLDTNVLSELMRPQPDASVLLWIEAQPVEDLYISAMTMAEILHGIARLPHGKRKQMLHASALAMFEEDFIDRIAPFGTQAALYYAHLISHRESLGRPISLVDAQIAAICRVHDAAIATRNAKDFSDTGLIVINPWLPLEV